jgi:hypothetical protein
MRGEFTSKELPFSPLPASGAACSGVSTSVVPLISAKLFLFLFRLLDLKTFRPLDAEGSAPDHHRRVFSFFSISVSAFQFYLVGVSPQSAWNENEYGFGISPQSTRAEKEPPKNRALPSSPGESE